MFAILPILIYFITSVACIPFYTRDNLFNLDCKESIQKELYTKQGVNPDLNIPAEFGYIYSIDSTLVKLDADIQITQSSSFKELGNEIPYQATSVLSSISYKEQDNQFILKGRISEVNSDKIKGKSLVGTQIQLRFDVFTFDKSKSVWYRSFTAGSGEPGGITGTVTDIRVIHQAGYPELIIELTPKVRDENAGYEYLEYAVSSSSASKQISWSASACKTAGNKSTTFVASKRDQFNEVVESAVLL